MAAEKKAKLGRPRRAVPVEKLNLLIATAAKRRAFEISVVRGISMGRLIEGLIEAYKDSNPYRRIAIRKLKK
jgi:hypothetical protein